ncbi:TolC family protein [Kolteria novifilia]|uniref:TolC family protein n=1 Tax=Kolteria novifilia TaxID=2527975 RepID=UPI003AF3F6B3
MQAAFFADEEIDGQELFAQSIPDVLSVEDETDTIAELPDLIGLALEQNPRLAQVGWAVDVARGRALQAGLYPNPVFAVTGNEISDRTGPGGIWSTFGEQEFVTAHKLGLSRAAALKEVDQATLAVISERYVIFTEVRRAFFEAVTLQQRAEILTELVGLAEQSVRNAQQLLEAKEGAVLDVVQFEVDLERYRADLEATQQALPAAYRKVAASVGVDELTIRHLVGTLDLPLPEYELDPIRLYVLGIHPDIRSAQVGVERARLVLRRAEVEPIPNVTVGAGYTYQGQNRSNDWDIGVSVPIPTWDRNQGNIFAARAQVSEAVRQIGRVENELVDRLATSFSAYAAARARAVRYRDLIVPKAQQTYSLSLKAYQGGQFQYLRVLEAQRAVVEAKLELVRSLGDMWEAASVIAGLMLEDQWPPTSETPQPERNDP